MHFRITAAIECFTWERIYHFKKLLKVDKTWLGRQADLYITQSFLENIPSDLESKKGCSVQKCYVEISIISH